MSWEQVVSRAGTDEAFKSEIVSAQEVTRGEQDKNFVSQDFCTADPLSLEVEKTMLMLPESEFATVFGKGPTKGIGITKFAEGWLRCGAHKNEYGQDVNALLLADSSPFRTVKLRWSGGTELQGRLHLAQQQVRPEQGRDLACWYNDDMSRNLEQQLQPKAQPPTLEAVKEKLCNVTAEMAPAEPEVRAPLQKVGLPSYGHVQWNVQPLHEWPVFPAEGGAGRVLD